MAAAIAAGAAAVGQGARQHPAAAAATAGAVAVAGTAAGALYLGGRGPDSNPIAIPPSLATALPRAPRAEPTTTPRPTAPRTPTNAPQTPPKSATSQPPETRTMGTGTRILVPRIPAPVLTLPPVSPSPPGQHPSCIRFELRPLVGLRVCRR